MIRFQPSTHCYGANQSPQFISLPSHDLIGWGRSHELDQDEQEQEHHHDEQEVEYEV